MHLNQENMKTLFLKLALLGFAVLCISGMVLTPTVSTAQEAAQDTVQAVEDKSSSFNDSVQFDDMEPIFFEATEDDEEVATDSGSSSIILYVGIAVALLVILIVLKKVGKKKSA